MLGGGKKRSSSTSSTRSSTIVNNFVPPTSPEDSLDVVSRQDSSHKSRKRPYRLSVATKKIRGRNSPLSPTMDHLSIASPTPSTESNQFFTASSRGMSASSSRGAPEKKSLERTFSGSSIITSSDSSDDEILNMRDSNRNTSAIVMAQQNVDLPNTATRNRSSSSTSRKGSGWGSFGKKNSSKYRIATPPAGDNEDASIGQQQKHSSQKPILKNSSSVTSLHRISSIIKENPSADPATLLKDYEVQHVPPSRSFFSHFSEDYLTFRDWIWNLFEQDVPTMLGKLVTVFLVGLIVFSVILFVISTEPYFQVPGVEWPIFGFEYIISLIFLVEYLLRFFSCTSSTHYSKYGPIFGRLRFMISLGSLVDLIAVVPSLITLNWILFACMAGQCQGRPNDVLPIRSTFTVMLRFFRFARLGKLERHFRAVSLLKTIITNKFSEIMLAAFVILFTTTLVATLMWMTEGDNQPEAFGSIIRSYYYVFILLSTIGLGDNVPKTLLGKLTSVAAAVIAISIFSLPTAIISSTLMEQLELKRERKKQIQQKVMQFKKIAQKKQRRRTPHMLRAITSKSKDSSQDKKETNTQSQSVEKPRISIGKLEDDEKPKKKGLVQTDSTNSIISSPNSDSSQKSIITSSDEEDVPTTLNTRARKSSVRSNTSGASGMLKRSESRSSMVNRRLSGGFSQNGNGAASASRPNTALSPNGAAVGGAPFVCCPNCNHRLQFNLNLFSSAGGAVTSSGTGSGGNLRRGGFPTSLSSNNLSAETLSQNQEEESAEEIWSLFKKQRGNVVEIKEFCRVMSLKGFSFTKKEVFDMLESIGHRSNKITFSAFKAMMGFEDPDDDPAQPQMTDGFGTFGL